MAEMNSTYQRVLQYFTWSHLPENLQSVSEPCSRLAYLMVTTTDGTTNPAEVTVGLRKLLEAKDCFVRAMLK